MNQLPKKILCLDDEEIALEASAEYLEAFGYQVICASTLEEVDQLLTTTYVHMMLVDLCLEPEDERDRSGLELIENIDYAIIPKVVLTGFDEDPKSVRRAFAPENKDVPAAVNYIGKNDEGRYELISQEFDEHVNVNWDLQINWLARDEGSISRLTSLIADNKDSAYFVQWMEEVESLLCQLFLEASQITIGRRLLHHADVVWWEVATWSVTGNRSAYIIACGQTKEIEQQLKQYDTYAPKESALGNLQKIRSSQTLRFQAILYESVGNRVSEMISLDRLYTRYPCQDLMPILDSLYSRSLMPWHNQERETDSNISTLNKFYEIWEPCAPDTAPSADEWQEKVESLCSEARTIPTIPKINLANHTLTVDTSTETIEYPEPTYFLQGNNVAIEPSIQQGIILGNLRLTNILVDTGLHGAWIIDHSRVQKGPLLRDFVALESALKTELLLMLPMEQWLALEVRLLTLATLDTLTPLDDFSPEVQKVLLMIGQIRQQAKSLADDSLHNYRAALFLHAISQLRHYDPEKNYLRHSIHYFLQHLFTTAIISKSLTIPRQFEFDAEQSTVIVEGKTHELPGREETVLKYMYERPNQLCTFRELLVALGEITDDKYDEVWFNEFGRQNLNAIVRRLRQRVEPNPENPRYIITVRGRGYKLVL